MSGFDLFSNSMAALTRAIDASSVRQSLIADNIANVETPGYHRKDLNFPGILQQKISDNIRLSGQSQTNPNHFPISSSPVLERNHFNVVYPSVTQPDKIGNNVKIDMEMGNMAVNGVFYETLTTLLSRKFQNLKAVIRSSTGGAT